LLIISVKTGPLCWGIFWRNRQKKSIKGDMPILESTICRYGKYSTYYSRYTPVQLF
jgi:hypothetical protein